MTEMKQSHWGIIICKILFHLIAAVIVIDVIIGLATGSFEAEHRMNRRQPPCQSKPS